MPFNILVLGASYGSLLGTKSAMAGHNVTLVCRDQTANLININGTEVRIKFRGQEQHTSIRSGDLPGRIEAKTPHQVNPADYDLVALAMQEPQFGEPNIRQLMKSISQARVACMSLMNMPPLPYLRRIRGLDTKALEPCYTNPRVWDGFEPDLFTHCSPDPQAYRPSGEGANILHVNLPSNFKAAAFGCDVQTVMLRKIEADIAAVRHEGQEVPVKLKVFDSLYVPFAKWSMLLAGNYRCVTQNGTRSIRDAVHSDIEKSADVYAFVDQLVQALGANAGDTVPFGKYAKAAKNLQSPSSTARALESGATDVERVDRLVQLVGRSLGLNHENIDCTVAAVDAALNRNMANSK